MAGLNQKFRSSEVLQALASMSFVMMARAGGTVATLLYTIIQTRLLSPAQFGAVSSLWSLAQVLVPIATLNLAPVAIRAVVKARQAGDDALAAGFIQFTRRVAYLTGPVMIAIYLGIVYVRFPEILESSTWGVAMVAVSLVGLGWVQTGAAIGVALDRPAASQIPRELVRPLMILIALSVFFLFDWPLSLNMALALYAVTVLGNIAMQSWLLRDAMAFTRAQPARIEGAKNWITTGLFLLPTRRINDYAKIVMVVSAAAILSLEQVALITVALSLSGLLNFAISAAEMAFSAKLSRALHAGQMGRATKFLAISGVVKMVLCLVLGFAVLVLLEPLLGLFGKHYTAADDLTLILLGVPFVQALFGKADLVLLVHNLRSRIFWVQLVTLVLLPLSALASFALPQFDPARVTCTGFVFAFFLSYAGLWWIAKSQTGIDTSAPGAILAWLRNRKTSEGK